MLTEDQGASLRSAVKLVRMIVQETDLVWNKKAEADESLQRFLGAVLGAAELPDTSVYERRPAA